MHRQSGQGTGCADAVRWLWRSTGPWTLKWSMDSQVAALFCHRGSELVTHKAISAIRPR